MDGMGGGRDFQRGEDICIQKDGLLQVQSLGWEDLQEEEMATYTIILVWKIPWAEEPGGPQSMGSQRVGHE